MSKTLNLSLHKIHEEAERLEHLTSDFLADKMDQYLGFPAFDPNGDPIPCSDGLDTPESDAIVLSKAETNKDHSIVRLFSSDPDFFDFCASIDIAIGRTISVAKELMK